MDRKQFDKLIDYAKLKSSTSVINEAKYQLFRDENDPFVDVETIDEKLVRKSNSEGESVNIKGAKPLLMFTDARNDICFGRLLNEMSPGSASSKNKINRMWYRVNVFDTSITEDMVLKWVQIGMDSKMIPDSFEILQIKREKPGEESKEHYVLTVTNNIQELSAPIFYLGASFLRCLREKPNVVVAGIHLMGDLGLDPYVSFVFLHKYCITGSGHMPVNVETSYGEKVEKGTIKNIKVDAGLIIGLRRLIFSYKNDEDKMGKADTFNCVSTIVGLRPPKIARMNVNIYETMEPEFMNILECEPGSKAEDKAIKSFVDKKGNSNARQNYCART